MKENGATLYDSQDVIQDEKGNISLLINLGATRLHLKPRLVPDGTIFILDPREPETEAACVNALHSKITSWLSTQTPGPIRLLTPESGKSEQMVEKLAAKLSEKTACALETKMFLKGNSRAELEEKLGPNAYIIEYSPITHKSSHLGISQTHAQLLRQEYSRGTKFLIVDDVVSSEATMIGQRRLLDLVFEGYDFKGENVPAFAAARELPAGQTPAKNEPYIYSVVIPVFLA